MYKVEEPEFGRSVAVKVIQERLDEDSVGGPSSASARPWARCPGTRTSSRATAAAPPIRPALHRDGPDERRVAGRPDAPARARCRGRRCWRSGYGGRRAGDRAPGRDPAPGHEAGQPAGLQVRRAQARRLRHLPAARGHRDHRRPGQGQRRLRRAGTAAGRHRHRRPPTCTRLGATLYTLLTGHARVHHRGRRRPAGAIVAGRPRPGPRPARAAACRTRWPG